MNSKQTFKRLLLGLASIALGVTSCSNVEEIASSVISQSGSTSESQKESSSTVEESKPAESSSVEESKPTESSSVEESKPAESSSAEESKPAESSSIEESSSVESSTEEESSSQEELPEETIITNFDYNYAGENLAVWTNEEIDNTVAPDCKNVSNKADETEGKHTFDTFGKYGYYTFVVDSEGFIEYASYGTGTGWGSPTESKNYHNHKGLDGKYVWDQTNFEFYIFHEEFAKWPAKTKDGKNAWTLYDFVIPEGGFVITGWHNCEGLEQLWNTLFDEDLPVLTDLTENHPDNNQFLYDLAEGTLDKFYVSIGEDKELHIRERLETELKDEDGLVEDATPAINYTPTADDAVINYETISDVLTACAAEKIDTDDHIVKGVITSFYANGTLVIEDENGNAITVYGSKSLGNVGEKYQVGQTISVTGKLAAFKGLYEIKPNTADDVKVIDAYGKVAMPDATEVNEKNVADVITAANQGKLVKLIKAKVTAIDEAGSSTVELGDTTVTLFKVDFPETVQVGDYIDVTGSISVYDIVQLRVDSSAAISRYYTVTAEIDGNVETHGAAKGETVSLTATAKETYVFSKWVKVDGEEETEISTESDIDVVVEGDVTYKAVYEYAPWAVLESYTNSGNVVMNVVEGDAGADANSVLTVAGTKIHIEGSWNSAVDARWRAIVVVDANGQIAYAVKSPESGYGGPSGTSYMTVYEDYNSNPAINVLEGYGPWTADAPAASGKFEIVVPEGGFAIISHGSAIPSLYSAIFGQELTSVGTEYNSRKDVSAVKMYYDAAAKTVRVYRYVAPNASVYTSADTDITLGDYTVAVDNTGKIIFASRTSDGYGGPADGFYHDGSYALTAGSVCGIYDVMSDFAAWPATVKVGEEDVGAWTRYSVVCPENVTIITGSFDIMRPVVNLILGQEYTLDYLMTDYVNVFEGVEDGSLNDYVFAYSQEDSSKPIKYTRTKTTVNELTTTIVNEDCGENAFSVITTAGTKLHVEGSWIGDIDCQWRTMVVVDKDGKIAYAVRNPQNGYGGPSSQSYMTVYADYTKNPAINVLEGYGSWSAEAPDASKKFEIVVPEDGFAILMQGDALAPVYSAIFAKTIETVGNDYNARIDVSGVVIAFDAETNKLTFTNTEVCKA